MLWHTRGLFGVSPLRRLGWVLYGVYLPLCGWSMQFKPPAVLAGLLLGPLAAAVALVLVTRFVLYGTLRRRRPVYRGLPYFSR